IAVGDATLFKVNLKASRPPSWMAFSRGRWRFDRFGDALEIPEPAGLRGLRLQVVQMARAREALYRPSRECGGARGPGRIVVRDMVRMGARQFDRLLHEVPAAIDHARADARAPGPDEVADAQGREEFLRPFRHDALRDGRGAFLRGERDEIRIHEEPELVAEGDLEEFLRQLFRAVEEGAVRVRSRVGCGVRPARTGARG